MTLDKQWVKCSECDSPEFYVVWKNNGFDRPMFCPFCGAEMDYLPDDEDEEEPSV